MGKRELLVLIAIGLFLIPAVSAEIFFSQPTEIYNIGEWFSMDLRIRPNSNTQDFLNADINCNGETVNIYRNFLNINAGEERVINIAAVLSNNLLGERRGDCFLSANYGADNSNSQTFKISDLIEVELDLDKTKFNPGENIFIFGEAKRESGINVGGFVEVRADSLGILVVENVNEGIFNVSLTLPENAPSGEHNLILRVYEKNNLDEITNEGAVNENIDVNAILERLEIVVNSENVFPEEEYSVTINAFDQSNALMEKEVTLRIFDTREDEFIEEIAISGVERKITFSYSEIPGYWKIEASADDLLVRKLFYLEEVMKVESNLEGNMLVITNVGNVPYRGPVEIGIGEDKEVKEISLRVGESKRFELYAPDGSYQISVSNGEQVTEFGSVALTGKAIGVKELGSGISFSSPLMWIIAIIVLGLIVFFIRRRTKKLSERIEEKNLKPAKISENSSRKSLSASALSMDFGQKEEATVIALRFQNVPGHAGNVIADALGTAKSSGGKVYTDGHYRILIFAPSSSKVKENDVLAVKVGKRIEEMFLDNNKRFKDKILFGMGINSGEMIVENKGGEMTFTSVGNTVTKAKGIASGIGNEVLLSDLTHRRVINQVKTEKLPDKELWRVTKITDRSKHEDFLSRFKSRSK